MTNCTHENLPAGQSIGWQDDDLGTLTELLNCPDCGSTLGGRQVIRVGYQRPGPLTQYVRKMTKTADNQRTQAA